MDDNIERKERRIEIFLRTKIGRNRLFFQRDVFFSSLLGERFRVVDQWASFELRKGQKPPHRGLPQQFLCSRCRLPRRCFPKAFSLVLYCPTINQLLLLPVHGHSFLLLLLLLLPSFNRSFLFEKVSFS